MNTDINAWADSRNTSTEIALAIHGHSTLPAETQAIWADPSDEERENIVTAAWQAVYDDDSGETELHWGEEVFQLSEWEHGISKYDEDLD